MQTEITVNYYSTTCFDTISSDGEIAPAYSSRKVTVSYPFGSDLGEFIQSDAAYEQYVKAIDDLGEIESIELG